MLNHLLIQEGATHPLTRADLPPTREVPTPRYTIPRYTTPPPPATHPSTPATRRLKGADPYSAKRIYMPTLRTRVSERVYWLTVRACATERISKRRANLWPRGARFLSSVLFRPSFKAARTSFRFPHGNSFPKFRRGKSSFLPCLVGTGCCGLLRLIGRMHGYMHDASRFANRDLAVLIPRLLIYLIIATKMRHVDDAIIGSIFQTICDTC